MPNKSSELHNLLPEAYNTGKKRQTKKTYQLPKRVKVRTVGKVFVSYGDRWSSIPSHKYAMKD